MVYNPERDGLDCSVELNLGKVFLCWGLFWRDSANRKWESNKKNGKVAFCEMSEY